MGKLLIGNVKGPQGDTGATGAQGVQGEAATINVGSVSTTAYGNAARVENVGTENDAILNFTIPQGAPGQRTTTMSGLTLDTVTTSAEEFPVPAVGENGATVWGKVIKWFADGLAAIRSKLDANKVVNSQTVTEAGYALDAQQANPNVSGSLAAQISGLNDSLINSSRSLTFQALSGITYSNADANITFISNSAGTLGFINGYINLTGATAEASFQFKLVGSGITSPVQRLMGFCFRCMVGNDSLTPTKENNGRLTLETDGSITGSVYVGGVTNKAMSIAFHSCVIFNP